MPGGQTWKKAAIARDKASTSQEGDYDVAWLEVEKMRKAGPSRENFVALLDTLDSLDGLADPAIATEGTGRLSMKFQKRKKVPAGIGKTIRAESGMTTRSTT